MSRFPHLANNESNFPDVSTVNVYQYDNDFDYARYDYTQMKLTVCTVPWDMGEAHIGARTISGIGNVVAFKDRSVRDAWFEAIPDSECFRFETKFKDLHRDNAIEIPLPFDVAARFNYIMVEYSLFANDGSPIRYENENGLRKWFWFIREVEFLSPNATRLHLMIDAWQTFIYDIEIGNMILERGHAPMFATTVSQYLADPIDNCSDMLAEDVNYGDDAQIVKKTNTCILNASNMKCVIISSANVTQGVWGSKSDNTWNVPGNSHFQTQGVPSLCAFCLDPSQLSTFLFNVDALVPQFMQTVRAVCFVAADLLAIGTAFTFADVTCNVISSGYVEKEILTLSKDDFGYEGKYSNIPKLYTSPYAHLELSDENGNVSIVRVEDTEGHLKIQTTVNLVFPWLRINGHLEGIGRAAAQNLVFTNVDLRNMPISGNWYKHLKTWNIPTFSVTQAAATMNDYATHFDRLQQALAANNTYDNVVETADTLVDNADLTAATNTATTTRSNTALYLTSSYQYSYNNEIRDADNAATATGTTATTQAQEQQAAISAASGALSGAVGALGSIATGNVAGAVGAISGAVIGGLSTMASTSVAVSLTQAQGTIAQTSNNAHTFWANELQENKTDVAQDEQTDIAELQNDLTTGSAANSSAMQLANGTRDLNTATNAIANSIAQAALGDVTEFGQLANGETAVNRPMGMFANIVTQDDYAIKRAGDEFLRYGYMYNGQWAFDGNWNIGKYFTYWKVRDFWIKGLSVPDMYVDRIRFFLFGGVTVWSDPAAIGNVTIYENMGV